MAVDALFQRHLLQQLVDGQRNGLLHLAVNHHLPRADRQLLRRRGDALGRAELIVVVEGGGIALIRQRALRIGIGRVGFRGVQRGGRVLRGQRRAGRRQRHDAGRSTHEAAPVQEHMLRRYPRFGDIPAVSALDQHARVLLCVAER